MGSLLARTAPSPTEARTAASGFPPLLARQIADVSAALRKKIAEAEDAKEGARLTSHDKRTFNTRVSQTGKQGEIMRGRQLELVLAPSMYPERAVV
jgi:hypothetical protein